jgi:hypothetical protein
MWRAAGTVSVLWAKTIHGNWFLQMRVQVIERFLHSQQDWERIREA